MKSIKELRAEASTALRELEVATSAFDRAGPNTNLDGLRSTFDAAESDHRNAVAKVERAEALDEAKRSLPVPIAEDDEPSRGRKRSAGSTRINREPLTYEPEGERSFFRDQLLATKGDIPARESLTRHMTEMVSERAIASTDGAGGDFIVPLHLQDEWMGIARSARVVADLAHRLPLPPNTDSITMPRLASGTAVAAQTDLGAVQSTDATTGTLTVPVITIAGQQDLSRQLFERGTPGLDEVIFGDLAGAYATALDVQCISGSGAGPNTKGILTVTDTVLVTYTDAAPTVPKIYAKIADAIQRIHTLRFQSPTVMVMHPRRWAWFLSALDTSNRPLVTSFTPSETALGAMLGADAPQGVFGSAGLVGSIQGLPVVTDANVPTNLGTGVNEDRIIVARAEDMYLWEDEQPRTKVYEDVLSGTLAVRLQLYGYSAFTAERYPKATAVIGGSGLIAPTFG